MIPINIHNAAKLSIQKGSILVVAAKKKQAFEPWKILSSFVEAIFMIHIRGLLNLVGIVKWQILSHWN